MFYTFGNLKWHNLRCDFIIISELKYNIDSHIDEIPDDSDEIPDDSEENQDSPRPIYTDDVILVENHRKQDSLSEINI